MTLISIKHGMFIHEVEPGELSIEEATVYWSVLFHTNTYGGEHARD